MVNMRNICQVINLILDVTPKDFDEKFIQTLSNLQKELMYKSPEAQHEAKGWIVLANIMNFYIPFPQTEDWKRTAIEIFTMSKYKDLEELLDKK
jgi:hypothetical protein